MSYHYHGSLQSDSKHRNTPHFLQYLILWDIISQPFVSQTICRMGENSVLNHSVNVGEVSAGEAGRVKTSTCCLHPPLLPLPARLIKLS